MNPTPEKPFLDIRKYPNRRLYDSTRSRHITADELYQLVRDGHDVRITDSASGADITHQILTQMILERDPPKLEVFPTTLLHEIIRANQQMWRAFVEQWMSGLSATITQQANAYAQRMAELSRRSLDGSVLGKLLRSAVERADDGERAPSGDAPAPAGAGAEPSDGNLRESLHRLEGQVRRLSSELAKRTPVKRRRPPRP